MESTKIYQGIARVVRECILAGTSSKVDVNKWCRGHAIDYDRDIELMRFAAIQIERDVLEMAT